LTSGESDGYFNDYADHPIQSLGKCLTEGFLFQGQPSSYRNGERRGEPSGELPLTSFIGFLQNHDQVGNRAFGERILSYAKPEAVRAIMAILLLAPSPPLLFMGEEFAADTPFLFFCDFEAQLAKAVTDGRRAEFAKFSQFRDEATRNRIPDPNDENTFAASKLNWNSVLESGHAQWLSFYSRLLSLRKKEIVPLLRNSGGLHLKTAYSTFQENGLAVCWQMGNKNLQLLANLGDKEVTLNSPHRRLIYATFDTCKAVEIPPWSAAWYANP
jgi:1,4-alpha-glucan branching enzyme